LFIKQHYIADEIAGIALAWIVGTLLFKILWKSPALTKQPSGQTKEAAQFEIGLYLRYFSLLEVIIEPINTPIPKATEAKAKVS